MRFIVWWHRVVRGHRIQTRRVTVPMWDPWSTGELIDCECGKGWAR